MQFRDIKGQTALCNHLTEAIDAGRVSHSQLFHGATTSGSLALALAYAQYLLCENRQHFAPDSDHDGLRADSCGECPHCKKLSQLIYTDLMIFFPTATTTAVKSKPCSSVFNKEIREFLTKEGGYGTLDDWFQFVGIGNGQGMVREADAAEIVQKLSLKPYEGSWTVVVVWMAERMNPTTANKLLKTLEEPNPNTVLLLVAEETDHMLPTILSRTQRVSVPGIKNEGQWQESFPPMFVNWMRLLFKLNMAALSNHVDQISTLRREDQKQFLLYVIESIHTCFLRTVAGQPTELNSGDERFDSAFPAMVTQRNVEKMSQALNDALHAIERNASSKITFMHLSFILSKLIKQR